MTDLQTRIDKARWWAIQTQPFYGTLSMRLIDKIVDTLPTAATDGRHIYWGRAFCERLTDQELRFVLLHETLHCAHQHLWRLPRGDLGNMAGDYAINAILSDIGPACQMPKDGLLDPKYDGLSEEEILKQLQAKPPKNGGQGYTDACGTWTDAADPHGDGPSQAKADGASPSAPSADLSDAWKEAVIQAAQAAKAAQGDVPADMARVIQAATARRIDWRAATAEFIKRAVGSRNDWSRPSRRSAGRSYIIPRKKHDALGLIVAVRDTSGSVDGETLGAFNACIEAACADTDASCVLIDADADVAAEYWLKPGDGMPDTAQGGGGTDFRPAFRRATQIAEDEAVSGIVYLTDMEGAFPDSCEIPTLWVSVGEGTAPFGRVVKLETE